MGFRGALKRLLYSGLRRPNPGRWPEPAGAPRRLPDGASLSRTRLGRLVLGAGLAGRLLSVGRSATGVPRVDSPRPAAGRGARGARSPSWRGAGLRAGRSPSIRGSRSLRSAGAPAAGRRVRTRSPLPTGREDLRCIRSSLSLLLALSCGMATGVRPTSALRISTSYWLISRQPHRQVGIEEHRTETHALQTADHQALGFPQTTHFAVTTF